LEKAAVRENAIPPFWRGQAAGHIGKGGLTCVEIVGDELHPLLKITDFSPYIAKIRASGADTVVTGNWGQDFALLLKAAADAGLQSDWYTYYAGAAGGPHRHQADGAFASGFPDQRRGA
jgi:ABC-type branched-subunit amino acid transport system substrate-binding protein